MYSDESRDSDQVKVVAFSLPQLRQALFIQKKNQTLQNRFLISVMLRWHSFSSLQKSEFLKLIIFHGQYSRAVDNQERVIMACVW